MNPFQTHDASIVFANGGGSAPPLETPRCFVKPGKLASKHMNILSKPMMQALCLQMGGGGGCAPPQPPRCFLSPGKLASKHMNPSNPMMRALFCENKHEDTIRYNDIQEYITKRCKHIYNNTQKDNNIQVCTRVCSNIHVKKE